MLAIGAALASLQNGRKLSHAENTVARGSLLVSGNIGDEGRVVDELMLPCPAKRPAERSQIAT